MLRAILPSGRKSLFFACAAISIGAVWWWQRPPPDLKDHGLWLSEYLGFQGVRSNDPRPLDERLRSFGPGGVKWLIHRLEHGQVRKKPPGPLPLDKAPEWLRQITPQRWGGLINPVYDERVAAASLLKLFGPDAAPAIPALVKKLDYEAPEVSGSIDGQLAAEQAARALHAIGPAAAPAIREILNRGSPCARAALAETIWTGPRDFGRRPSEAEIASMLAASTEASHDPSPKVRQAAAVGLGSEEMSRKNQGEPDLGTYDSAIPLLIQLLSDENQNVLLSTLLALRNFEDKAAPAVPRLIELLNHGNPTVRRIAALVLSEIDKVEKRSIPHLQLMLQDPDADCRRRAQATLKELGIPPPYGKSSSDSSESPPSAQKPR